MRIVHTSHMLIPLRHCQEHHLHFVIVAIAKHASLSIPGGTDLNILLMIWCFVPMSMTVAETDLALRKPARKIDPPVSASKVIVKPDFPDHSLNRHKLILKLVHLISRKDKPG